MEKNIEWLKEEISKLRGYAVIIDGEDGQWEPVTTVSMEDIYELINQLDKLEVLSQEWINKHSNGPSRSRYVWVDDLKEILVSKQEDMFNGEEPDEGEVYFAVGLEGAVEVSSASNIDEAIERLAEHETSYSILKKPAIPKFIAEAIEEDKERGYDVYDSIDLIIETNGGGLPSISDWVARNIDKYARAYLTGRYEVEEEQKYIVSDNSSIPLLIKNDSGEIMSYDSQIAYNNSNGTIELTEQEIKSYDERYFAFAKPVEEVEG